MMKWLYSLLLIVFLTNISHAVPDDRFVVIKAKGINKSLYNALQDGDILTTGAASGTPVQETPSGSGTTFSLAYTPTTAFEVTLYIDGLLLTQGSGKDYTISGANITLSTALETGQVIWAVYKK